jgi:hypothetical protein
MVQGVLKFHAGICVIQVSLEILSQVLGGVSVSHLLSFKHILNLLVGSHELRHPAVSSLTEMVGS